MEINYNSIALSDINSFLFKKRNNVLMQKAKQNKKENKKLLNGFDDIEKQFNSFSIKAKLYFNNDEITKTNYKKEIKKFKKMESGLNE